MEVNACCQRGIWHTGHDLSTFDFLGTVSPVGKEEIKSKLKYVLDKNRKYDCFFVEYSEGMSFDGAIELYRIRNESRNLKRSLRYAVIGLYSSAAAALFNFIGFDNVARFFEWIFDGFAS
ncbi:MAG: hypothetical protein OXF62_20555 [Caldilineaceae bacterium]|nr:hypothetical protein [Caldilineaceae bacterium]